MLRRIALLAIVCSIGFIAGCPMKSETMSLLDEKVAVVKISKSKGDGGINEDYFLSFENPAELEFLQKAITTAEKASDKIVPNPDYDVLVEYGSKSDGGLPTHGLHLTLGKKGQASQFMYIEDDMVYLTTPEVTNKLRELILDTKS
ncbi:hypothetical protein JNUCC1_02196 [Lentibacillus sp. JNUCC-1]|uniref:hypothetical protein n=1 Tax=Lentibacillus sp. JNUCC-1 TaxID=2654513 RepID=UPI0012E95173|nr:hypothetical protein [Lentibacillus sp. JNUCC-1]MUV38358.1 hypothetical protein [Lentibacillus sp. JNUCC-1]